MKKIVAFFLAMTFLLGALPVYTVAAAAYSGTCGGEGNASGVSWSFDASTGTLTISGSGPMFNWYHEMDMSLAGGYGYNLEDYLPKDKDYVYTPWYSLREKILHAVVSDGITNLGDFTFSGCENLKDVKLGKDITVIGHAAFETCTSLTAVSIPSGVTSIGVGSFFYNTKLKSISLPEGVESLGHGSFAFCYELQEVDLPSTLTTMNALSFAFCRKLPSIEIPAGVPGISGYTFYKCSVLAEVRFLGNLKYINQEAFTECFYLNNLIIPETVTSINDTAFNGCRRLVNFYVFPGSYGETYCKNKYTDDKYTISTISHEWKVVETVLPDCGNQGYTLEACINCGLQRTVDVKEPVGSHLYGNFSISSMPTCDAPGFRVRTCSVCGNVDSVEIPALGHKYNPWKLQEEATCANEGVETRSCKLCGTVETRYLPKTDHTYTAVVTPPSCGEQGYTTYTCVCGDSYVDHYVEALPHTMGEWVVTSAPTCTEEGTKTRTCTGCSYSETEILPKTDHTYTAVVTPPTCTDRGYTTYTCECGDTFIGDYTETVPHTMGDWEVTTAPTCTAEGIKTRTCTGCSYTETEILPKTDHTYTAVVTPPTCMERGYTTYTCECGDTFIGDYTETVPHTMGDWEVTTAPTCTEDGVKTRTCTGCSYSETEILPKTDHTYTAVVTPPTCMERGYTTYTCECGDTFIGDYTDTVPHTMGEWEVTTSPTCTEEGTKTRTCTGCSYSETESIRSKGHELGEWYTVVDPTVDHDGMKQRDCSSCDYSETAKIPAISHVFGDWVVVEEPTCTSQGIMQRVCVNCGEIDTETIPKLDHTYTAEVTLPTCTDRGYTTYTCECGASYVSNYTDLLPHTMGEWEVTTAPTCTAEGIKTRICTGCSYTETENVPKTEHTYTTVVTPSTCTDRGYTTYTCECGASYVSNYTDILPHTMGDWEVTTAPTCTAEGIKTRICTGCSYTETESVPKTEHTYTAEVTLPTCTDRGYTTYTCECGDTYIGDYTETVPHTMGDWQITAEPTETSEGEKIRACTVCGHTETVSIPALYHVYGDWTVTKQPTCTESGTRERTCSDCGKVVTESIPAKGHDYQARVTPATCENGGYTTYICRRCGAQYIGDYTEILPHTYGEWTVSVPATCTQRGEQKRECQFCHRIEYEILPATGHTYETVVTPPTCEKHGYTTYTCHCGDVKVEDTVPATGHTYETVVTPPTCEKHGYTTYTCHCGDVKVEDTVPATGHTYETVVTPPTCEEQGYTTYTCHCGDVKVEDTVPATGHQFGEWTSDAPGVETRTCTSCGKTETRGKTPPYDVDGNGIVQQADAVLLLSILVGNTSSEGIDTDMDFDGKLTIYDCVLLLQYLETL